MQLAKALLLVAVLTALLIAVLLIRTQGTWRGTDPSLKPMLLIGHLDVVPIEPGTENRWSEGPFSGKVSGGFIWGRGASTTNLLSCAWLA